MTPETLQALRRLLFFTRQEAAALVAASAERPRGVTDRTWRMWEAGEVPVPGDVAATLRNLCAWRDKALGAALAEIRAARKKHGTPARIALVWYATQADWDSQPDHVPLYWRPHCSVAAAVAAAVPEVELHPFEEEQ